jgi:hypothetical protein
LSLHVAVGVNAIRPADALAGLCDELRRRGAAILIFGEGILPAHLVRITRGLKNPGED